VISQVAGALTELCERVECLDLAVDSGEAAHAVGALNQGSAATARELDGRGLPVREHLRDILSRLEGTRDTLRAEALLGVYVATGTLDAAAVFLARISTGEDASRRILDSLQDQISDHELELEQEEELLGLVEEDIQERRLAPLRDHLREHIRETYPGLLDDADFSHFLDDILASEVDRRVQEQSGKIMRQLQKSYADLSKVESILNGTKIGVLVVDPQSHLVSVVANGHLVPEAQKGEPVPVQFVEALRGRRSDEFTTYGAAEIIDAQKDDQGRLVGAIFVPNEMVADSESAGVADAVVPTTDESSAVEDMEPQLEEPAAAAGPPETAEPEAPAAPEAIAPEAADGLAANTAPDSRDSESTPEEPIGDDDARAPQISP
jgi:hypothetical protein